MTVEAVFMTIAFHHHTVAATEDVLPVINSLLYMIHFYTGLPNCYLKEIDATLS